MSGIDLSDLEMREIINDFLKSPEGRSLAVSKGTNIGYSDAELIALAEELKSMITAAFIANQHQKRPRFDDSGVKIQVVREPRKTELGADKYIRISYSDKTLHRYSLVANTGVDYDGSLYGGDPLYYTGEGIDDIFALFTSGYTSSKRVYGYWADYDGWERDDYNGLTASLRHRDPNSFIADTIRSFQAMHPDVDVSYPDEWKVGGGG